MNSRTMTGRLLILAPITIMAAWFGWGGILGFPDSGDHAAMVAAISQNPDTTKWLLGIAVLGMFMLAAGLQGLKNIMSGGSGSDYTSMGVLFFTMSIAAGLGEIALTIAAADAGAAGMPTIAMPIYLAGNGIGALTSAGMFLGFMLIGYGVYIQKNFNKIIPCLLFLTALFGLTIALYDYGSGLVSIGYLGMSVSTLAMGITILRSTD
jgi:hypothetical protein